MSQKIYESVTGSILDALRRGVVPWRKPWDTSVAVPTNAITNRSYRGVNIFLLGFSSHQDNRWLTFKQAQELGGKVKPGEKSQMVILWKQWKPAEGESEEDVPAWKKAPLLRYYNVFNAEQCQGLDLPQLYVSGPLPEHARIERAELMVRSMPDPPAIREDGVKAWYRPADDLVQIPPIHRFSGADAFYQTLFHELGHSTGHAKRLNRAGVAGVAQFGSELYSKEELVAELTAAFCCATVSLDNSLSENSASYINGWLPVLQSDPKAVVIAAAQAQRAADYIKGITYNG